MKIFIAVVSLCVMCATNGISKKELDDMHNKVMGAHKNWVMRGKITTKSFNVASSNAEIHNVTSQILISRALAVFNNITIATSAEFEKETVITNSRLETVITSAAYLSLEETCVGAIKATAQDQIIELRNTTVSGDIAFEHGNGIVVLYGSSKIHGDIIGGTVVKESSFVPE